MGPKGILTQAAQQEAPSEAVGVAAYKVVRYAAPFLPETYRSLIYSRWKRSFRHGNDYVRLIKPDAYYAAYDRYIRTILGRPDTAVRLAVLADLDDVVLGFSIVRGTILDYVHVHKDQRRLGIAKSLVPLDINTITHLTRTGLTIWGSKYSGWDFNPFA